VFFVRLVMSVSQLAPDLCRAPLANSQILALRKSLQHNLCLEIASTVPKVTFVEQLTSHLLNVPLENIKKMWVKLTVKHAQTVTRAKTKLSRQWLAFKVTFQMTYIRPVM